jgi:hypothetical protein
MIREARALANVLLDHHHDCDAGLLPRRFPSIVTLSLSLLQQTLLGSSRHRPVSEKRKGSRQVRA